MKIYITLTAIDYYLDINEIKVGEELLLEKDKDNIYDGEAIKVLGNNRCIKGYVANSINTVCKGTHSAGYIYDKFDDQIKCIVRFVFNKGVIAEIEY